MKKQNLLPLLLGLVLFITLQSSGCRKDELNSASIGTVGQSGGIIFYDKGHYSDGWRYLEAAPHDVAGLYKFGCLVPTEQQLPGIIANDFLPIGRGKLNTSLIVALQSDVYASSSTSCDISQQLTAAKVCDEYTLNGYDDWFLPSHYEFKIMAQNIGVERGNIGNLYIHNHYWTSGLTTAAQFQEKISRPKVEWGNGNTPSNWSAWITSDSQENLRVRPVRAY